jgi:hypothetical protein
MHSFAERKRVIQPLEPHRRSVPMSQQLTFLQPEPPAGAVPVWETLQADRQQAIRALLARLMRQVVLAQRTPPAEGHPDD